MSEKPSSFVLLVNPRAGAGRAERRLPALERAMRARGLDYTLALTERAGDATRLVREALGKGTSGIAVVGGDGTLNEATNGFFHPDGRLIDTKAWLGPIPCGTGGDFRKTLGIEHRLDKYLDALASGHERPLDVGRFSGGGKNKHYFVNILSAGMGGLVDRYVADAPRLLGGTAAYFGASFKALLNARLGNVTCRITNDGKEEEHRIRSFMIAICNGRYFGSGMKVAPMAEIDDGVFELVALGATSKLAFAMTSRGIYTGAHIGQTGTVHLRGQKIVLDLANEDARDVYLLDVDGEPMGGLPLTVEVVPKALVLRA